MNRPSSYWYRPLLGSVVAGSVLLFTPAVAAAAPTHDERGFVDTAARCDESQIALAMGRTERSLVAICVDRSGHHEYRGVRLRDDAALTVPAESREGGVFAAENDGVVYTVSPAELVISAGEYVIRTEPMLEYFEPRLPAEAAPSASQREQT